MTFRKPLGEHPDNSPVLRPAEERKPATYSFRPRVGIPENVPPQHNEPQLPEHTQSAGKFRSTDHESLEIEDNDGEEEDIVPYPKSHTS